MQRAVALLRRAAGKRRDGGERGVAAWDLVQGWISGSTDPDAQPYERPRPPVCVL